MEAYGGTDAAGIGGGEGGSGGYVTINGGYVYAEGGWEYGAGIGGGEDGAGANVTINGGIVVAKSGNSGRSYAPHLHYQLEDSKGKILDPFEVHETYRKTIPDADRAAFDAVVQRYDQMLNKNPQ